MTRTGILKVSCSIVICSAILLGAQPSQSFSFFETGLELALGVSPGTVNAVKDGEAVEFAISPMSTLSHVNDDKKKSGSASTPTRRSGGNMVYRMDSNGGAWENEGTDLNGNTGAVVYSSRSSVKVQSNSGAPGSTSHSRSASSSSSQHHSSSASSGGGHASTAATSSSRTYSLKQKVTYAAYVRGKEALEKGDCKKAKSLIKYFKNDPDNATYKEFAQIVSVQCGGENGTQNLADTYSTMALSFAETGDCIRATQYVSRAKAALKSNPESTDVVNTRIEVVQEQCFSSIKQCAQGSKSCRLTNAQAVKILIDKAFVILEEVIKVTPRDCSRVFTQLQIADDTATEQNKGMVKAASQAATARCVNTDSVPPVVTILSESATSITATPSETE